jgi:hypothetical protein
MGVILEVGIGLVFVYLILSLVVSAINESIVAVTGRRAVYLEKGIASLLGGTLKDAFYDHGLVRALKQDGVLLNRLPSYLNAKTFSTVVQDLIGDLPMPATLGPLSTDPRVNEFANKVSTLPTDAGTSLLGRALTGNDAVEVGFLKQALSSLSSQAQSVVDLRANIEAWFNETMDRVTGWYKRRTRAVLFVIGLILVSAVNADTLNLVNALWISPGIRASVVAAATKAVESDQSTSQAADSVASALDNLQQLQLPLGWAPKTATSDPRRIPSQRGEWIAKVVGLLITAAALTFGAPFWFDLLKKIVSLRSSGSPPAASPAP